MPLDQALLAGGSSLLSTGINALSQMGANKHARRWQEKMYDWQRRDALTDWAMQNEYNHPKAQMERLRKAGLNPNLVYGSGATTEASAIRSSSAGSWRPEAPQVDLGGALMSFLDAKMKEAQTDNLTTQNSVLEEEKMLKAAQTAATAAGTLNTLADTRTREFDLDMKQQLKQISLEAAAASLDKTRAEVSSIATSTQVLQDRNEREIVAQNYSIKKTIEEILTYRMSRAKSQAEIDHIRQQIKNLESDNELKKIDIEWQREGVTKSDHIFWRQLFEYLGGNNTAEKNLREKSNNEMKEEGKKIWEKKNPGKRARRGATGKW